MKKIERIEFEAALADDLGWCIKCEDFTTEGVEPDAREYRCSQCRTNGVFGAEEAMMQDMFELVEKKR